VTDPNPLVAPVVEAPVSPWAGIWLAEDVETILDGVRSRSWVEFSVGGAAAGLDALAVVVDPVGSVLQYGFGWLLEHVGPLVEVLDWLAGEPATIAAQAATWTNVARALRVDADGMGSAVRWDTAEWDDEAGDAYREWAGNQQHATEALANAAETMAAIVEAAAGLIAGVRVMVRDAIAVLVSRLIDYAVEEFFTVGAATGLVVQQATALCSAWSDRIAHWLRDLLTSLRRLDGLTGELNGVIESIKRLLRRLRTSEPDLNRVRKRGAGNTQYFRLGVARAVAEKYGIDISGLKITLGDKKERGVCGCTYPDGSIVLFSPGFRSEEDLARTLVHERFHHDELAEGAPFPRNEDEADEWEDRAYDHEDEWWENQPIRPEPRTK
jgi:hypothetical protein